jgi:hypothetical protein
MFLVLGAGAERSITENKENPRYIGPWQRYFKGVSHSGVNEMSMG